MSLALYKKDIYVFSLCFILEILLLTSCAIKHSHEKRISDQWGKGLGVDPESIVEIANIIVEDMLRIPDFVGKRVIIDAKYFKNESSNILNKNLITDKLRTELKRAAQDKISFISDEYRPYVETPIAANYRLAGRMASLDIIDPKTGARKRYTQITFEMFNLATSELVWTIQYEIDRLGKGLPQVYR